MSVAARMAADIVEDVAEIALQRVTLAEPEQLERGHERVGDRREVRAGGDRPWAGSEPDRQQPHAAPPSRTSGSSIAAGRRAAPTGPASFGRRPERMWATVARTHSDTTRASGEAGIQGSVGRASRP